VLNCLSEDTVLPSIGLSVYNNPIAMILKKPHPDWIEVKPMFVNFMLPAVSSVLRGAVEQIIGNVVLWWAVKLIGALKN
jgi:hypothetical protein